MHDFLDKLQQHHGIQYRINGNQLMIMGTVPAIDIIMQSPAIIPALSRMATLSDINAIALWIDGKQLYALEPRLINAAMLNGESWGIQNVRF